MFPAVEQLSLEWCKSSYSDPERDCVEVAGSSDVVGVRDGKQGDGSPVLVFGAARWRDFLAALRNG
ncbi:MULTISPECIES: DUF397 domain-containing protein [unclassified Actinopolyspora]|uniref:DUF397 domain-containing protein n=1 Tax=unclassified Actinopolyspora TaxID=2639451 RepID=UPI0013F5C897|nr:MULTISPECIES: DUF397 domain-containing protein [unclassified Actinopolyspora]NHD19025.1 DUF397 domain-containing protein [Actinopolyspora sp. BKK2]NHE78190.1 DUF397 domain-containing protein [Actinopolyspora sp. BKK1]